MTIHEAIDDVQRVGSIGAENGRLKLRFPEAVRFQLEPAIDTLRQNREAALLALTAESATVPPAEALPESLADLARERAAQAGDAEAVRQEVWISWCEWKARDLNRLFREHGVTGQPGRISAATIQDGERRR